MEPYSILLSLPKFRHRHRLFRGAQLPFLDQIFIRPVHYNVWKTWKPNFLLSLTGKGILLNILTVGSSTENLSPGRDCTEPQFSVQRTQHYWTFWNCGHYLLLPPAGEQPQRKHPSSGAFLMGEVVSIWWSFHLQNVNSQQEASANCKKYYRKLFSVSQWWFKKNIYNSCIFWGKRKASLRDWKLLNSNIRKSLCSSLKNIFLGNEKCAPRYQGPDAGYLSTRRWLYSEWQQSLVRKMCQWGVQCWCFRT